ncbi:MAG: hypothetical protein QW478_05775 [Candidatus Micrarchaeaceae archaeon]
MKICILVRILWPAGTQKFAISQAKALSEEGNEVELVFLRKDASAAVYDDYLRGLNFPIMAEENNSIFVPLYDLSHNRDIYAEQKGERESRLQPDKKISVIRQG